MDILKDKYSITELSSILDITDHALRYYEKEFSLSIPKDYRGRRTYSPELANMMYQIKSMRDEGLEIKAIRKILLSDTIGEPPPVVTDSESVSMVAIDSDKNSMTDLKVFFNEFKGQLTAEISMEISTAKDHITKEITRSKQELGACVENGMRRLEAKMERHFLDVDRALGVWREKNRKNIFKKLLFKTLK